MQYRPLAWEPKQVGMSAGVPRGRLNSLRVPLVTALASTFPPSVTDLRLFMDDQSQWNGPDTSISSGPDIERQQGSQDAVLDNR